MKRIFRIRRTSAKEASANYVYHADVIADQEEQALNYAKAGKVRNWRWIDIFDTSQEAYINYESLGLVNFDEAKNPMEIM